MRYKYVLVFVHTSALMLALSLIVNTFDRFLHVQYQQSQRLQSQ